MAAWVKELFFHYAISAATVVMPAVTNCSTVALSMGSTGLPKCNAEVLAGFTNGILNETELFCDVWSIYKHQKAETLDFGHALPKNTQRNSSEPGFEKNDCLQDRNKSDGRSGVEYHPSCKEDCEKRKPPGAAAPRRLRASMHRISIFRTDGKITALRHQCQDVETAMTMHG